MGLGPGLLREFFRRRRRRRRRHRRRRPGGHLFKYSYVFHENVFFAGRFLFYVGNVALNLLYFLFVS